jgi:hypothetical protein
VVTTPAFALKIGDDSLGDFWPRGTLCAFAADPNPQARDVVLLRHRRSKMLALRRYTPPQYAGLVAWQPAYPVTSGEWLCIGRLQLVLPRAG